MEVIHWEGSRTKMSPAVNIAKDDPNQPKSTLFLISSGGIRLLRTECLWDVVRKKSSQVFKAPSPPVPTLERRSWTWLHENISIQKINKLKCPKFHVFAESTNLEFNAMRPKCWLFLQNYPKLKSTRTMRRTYTFPGFGERVCLLFAFCHILK